MKRNLRRDARAIFQAAVAAANPAAMVETELRRRKDLDRYRRIFVVGGGKASGTMARAAERVLGKRITAGCIAVKDGDTAKSKRIDLRPCGHPVPDQRGVAAAARIAELCAGAGENDLVMCLLSGGASALLPAPIAPITLAEKQATTKLLLASGATIHEINAVRKHISAIKGGRLAKLAAPAHIVTLALSDVVGDQLDVIGSGPTAPDPATFADALAVSIAMESGQRSRSMCVKLLRMGETRHPSLATRYSQTLKT